MTKTTRRTRGPHTTKTIRRSYYTAAAQLGLKAISWLLAQRQRTAGSADPTYTCGDIAAAAGCRPAHAQKVLRRLARSGILAVKRGPHGGFSLNRNAPELEDLRASDVVEAATNPMLIGGPHLGVPGLMASVDAAAWRVLHQAKMVDL